MSSQSLVQGPKGVTAAWETMGQVRFAAIDPETQRPGPVVSAPGPGRARKHPAIAVNAKGETLLVWAEGTAWQRGGALAWQVFDSRGNPTAEKGRVEGGIPVWSLPTAYVRPDGGFVIVH